MNPCPCGFMGDPKHDCKCTPDRRSRSTWAASAGRYWIASTCTSRCRRCRLRSCRSPPTAPSSASMREQVFRARAIQAARFHQGTGAVNSRMSSRQLRKFCPLDSECQGLLQTAMEELGLSARAHDRILRMSRTIADLDGSARDRRRPLERGHSISKPRPTPMDCAKPKFAPPIEQQAHRKVAKITQRRTKIVISLCDLCASLVGHLLRISAAGRAGSRLFSGLRNTLLRIASAPSYFAAFRPCPSCR